MIIPSSIRNRVATEPLAHVTTLNEDGSPHVTVVWLGRKATSSSWGTWACGRR